MTRNALMLTWNFANEWEEEGTIFNWHGASDVWVNLETM